MKRRFASKRDIIMTIADIFSALAEDRPCRNGMEKERVIMILREDVRKG